MSLPPRSGGGRGHSEAESGRGHEALYVVLRGCASFTLDGRSSTPPTGTFVLVADPSVYRRAVAAEPDTAVLALGGPPTFERSASEWIERARPHLYTEPVRARHIIDELRAARPDSPGVAIAEALLAVGRGERAEAKETLAAVLSAEPSVRTALERDPDLGPLLGDSG